MKSIGIVTGANGFLANNVIKTLEKFCEKIYLIDISYKNEITNGKLNTIKLDVTNETKVEKFFNEINFGNYTKSILINMASIDYKVSTDGADFKWNIENADVKAIKKSLEISLIGTFLMSKYFCKQSLKNEHHSSILNFASDLSILISNDTVYGDSNNHKPIDYAISKHGLIGLTKYFSVYYAENNIRVNAISPSGVKSDQNKDFINKYSKLAPMNRMLEPEEIEGAVEFLISNKSSFITGQNIIIDGGKSIW